MDWPADMHGMPGGYRRLTSRAKASLSSTLHRQEGQASLIACSTLHCAAQTHSLHYLQCLCGRACLTVPLLSSLASFIRSLLGICMQILQMRRLFCQPIRIKGSGC